QSYTNWRCIVIDSFSHDGSWEIIQDFSERDKRFELYQIPKNINFYHIWNFGLSKVKNKYFCILTSDDVWNKEWLEVAIQSLMANKNAIAAAARTRIINSDSQWKSISPYNAAGERFFKTESIPQLRNGIISSIASYFIGPIYTSIHSLVMKSEILNQGIRFAEDVGSIADCEWYICLGLYGDIIYHPEVEVGWRVYKGQSSQQYDEQKRYNLKKIYNRNRHKISTKLDSTLAETFVEMAEYYERTIRAYHYTRPYWINIITQASIEIPRLFKVLYTMPKEVLIDFLYQIRGKRFFVEEGIAIATKFYQIMMAKS
ncbi:MAG: glycosyltransferase, partial [Oscillatoriaceae bacterium SKYG93]|nr:glycosyltransferase [Oscillatoriaceae bacterium SKYG93]MDW8454213.1 glycosyltransferase family A protein [Oscillatoriaceae cyanobacterium SKYGB_i_bin93]